MSSGMVGADIAALRELGKSINHQAATLEGLAGRLTTAISHPSWRGTDATRFRGEWRSSHVVKLRAAGSALREAATAILAEASQQEKASAAASGGFGGQLAGSTHHRVSPKEYAALAGRAEGGKPFVHDGHRWTPVDEDELKRLGITPDMLDDPASGFHATVYRSEDGTYVVSYAGTNFGDTGGDVLDDALGAAPASLSRQSQFAVELAMTLDKSVDGELQFVGHSLGGRLAALSSVATDRPATTFNAAGVSDSELFYALEASGRDGHMAASVLKTTAWTAVQVMARGTAGDGPDIYAAERAEIANRVTNYSGSYDGLTIAQTRTGLPDALGDQITVPSNSQNLVTAHNLSDFVDNLPD